MCLRGRQPLGCITASLMTDGFQTVLLRRATGGRKNWTFAGEGDLILRGAKGAERDAMTLQRWLCDNAFTNVLNGSKTTPAKPTTTTVCQSAAKQVRGSQCPSSFVSSL